MDEFLTTIQTEYLTIVALFVTGTISFAISTVGGGGGSLMNVPIVNLLVGVPATAPIINLGALIGRPARLILFWKDINWKIVLYSTPASMIGAVIGGYLFVNIELQWLQIFIGLFLVSTIFQYRFGKKSKSFKMTHIGFIPLGFTVAVLGTIIGAMGPVLNPFYLNAGIEKEEMIATKAANSFFTGVMQIGTYSYLGSLMGDRWAYGLAMGIGATVGNIIGKALLKRTSKKDFRIYVMVIMVISGIVMITKQIVESI
ncbi:MAG: sulfite exporter TauE/SafE family protein [Flavobacteriales bacterium]|nr:sulfite exporter TauE/SafE family protein [Flavobacteriales bacterium]